MFSYYKRFLFSAETDLEKNEDMTFGTYRPYFHGELVAEYRNSMSQSTNLKPGIIVETSTTIVKEVDVYVEPGLKIITCILQCKHDSLLWFNYLIDGLWITLFLFFLWKWHFHALVTGQTNPNK